MELSGLNLSELTLDDIIAAMKMNEIIGIDIDVSEPRNAKVTDWQGMCITIDT